MRSLAFSAAALLSVLPAAFAQTFTDCNPMNTTGCDPMPALGGNGTFRFNDTWDDNLWKQTNGETIKAETGATFTIKRQGESPTLRSNFFMFFGRVSCIMKAAPGKGIVSSIMLQSETLDEIDWEFLGGDTTHVLTNYYGKGNKTMGDRGRDYAAPNPQADFHNYTIDWTKEKIEWWMDNKLMRTVKFEEALGGKNYPQTPMNIRLGIWSGGDPKLNPKETIDWAGGETDFSKAPFTMTVQHVYAQDYASGKEYQWTDDQSGSWQSVKIIDGKSKAIERMESPHGVRNRIKAMSTTTIIIIASSAGGVVVIGMLLCTFCCIKQRRAGRREHAMHEEAAAKEAAELVEYKRQMAAGTFGFGGGVQRPQRPQRVSRFGGRNQISRF